MRSDELQGVEIEFSVGWYDGPVTGVATRMGRSYWFEAEATFDPSKVRLLFLYPLAEDELQAERDLHELFARQAEGRPVAEWPAVLQKRDTEPPTKYSEREAVGWFLADG